MFVLSILDKILRLFGTSEQQLRWRQHTRRQQREQQRRARDNRDRHLTYAHKTCPACGAIADREARTCAVCSAPLPSWGAARLEKWVGRLVPGTGMMTGALLLLNGLFYLLTVARTGEIWGPNGAQAIELGANYGPLMTAGGEWWRLFTCHFIHFGVIHIAFNLIALAQIGPLVEEFYGTARATLIYLAGAVLSAVASHLWMPLAASGGASGAVLTLVGAGVAAGHLQGGPMGRALRNSLLKWVVFIALFGVIVPQIDNAAHFGGLVAGLVLGAALKSDRTASGPSRWGLRASAAALVLTTVVALGIGLSRAVDAPMDFSERAGSQALVSCRAAVEGDDVRAMAEACDRLARLEGFYANPERVPAIAALWREAGEPERAERLMAILRATGGDLPAGLLP